MNKFSFTINSEEEAKSLLSYMKCRLPNFMLSLRKMSQDTSESTCKWIPLPPLTKLWTDADVYMHFNLSEDDIKLINETNIIGYKDIEERKTIQSHKMLKYLKDEFDNLKIDIKKLISYFQKLN